MTTHPPSQAPQPAFGYSLQEARMLYYLLIADGDDQVAYEVWDDVVVIKKDGHIVEQVAQRESNPLTDNSPKPWHTIATWVKHSQRNPYNPQKAKFILFVLQNHPMGKILALFHEADDDAKAEKALLSLREHFWGTAPDYSKRGRIPASKKADLETILNADQQGRQGVFQVDR